MKKAKRVLALVLAFVMLISAFSVSTFAKQTDPEAYRSNPNAHLNSINVITLTAEEGCTQILDLLDGLLYKLNLKFDNYVVTNVTIIGDVKLTADLTNIDGVFYTLYNAVRGIADRDKTCLGNVVAIGGLSSGLITTLLGVLDLGDVEKLTVTALGDQNAQSRRCRNVPEKPGVSNTSDLIVLSMLTQFLSDNRNILKKIATNELGFGLLDGAIKGISSTTEALFKDFTGFLKNTLYGLLWDKNADAAPAGWTYDAGVQQIVNWLLVDGTGEAASNGGNSVFGANFEPIVPAMKEPNIGNGMGANITNQSVYHLVNNLIKGLLAGTIGDLLEGLLIDLLGIDKEANDGRGDTAIMSDTLYNTIIGAIEGLCVANGAPAIVYTEEEKTYPIPQIEKLLDWFFNGGGLSTFVVLEPGQIGVTDNFMSLLGDIIRILPSLFPLFGISVPKDIEIPAEDLTRTVTHELWGDIYITLDGYEIFISDPEDIVKDSTDSIDFAATPTYYLNSDVPNGVVAGTLVNTSDISRAGYRNPKFIRQEYETSTSQVYAYILKIVLNSFIDGCYFPAWTDSIASVGAYGLASLAARYMPENNFFDRLDKYHYDQIGQAYTPKGASGAITAMPYEELVSLQNGTVVRVPRAAADIAACIGAYFFNAIFSCKETLGYAFETDTNFETLVMEFLVWGVSQYVTLLSGTYNSVTKQFTAYPGITRTVWMNALNTNWTAFNNIKNSYPSENKGIYSVAHTPSNLVAPYLFNLIDNTIFTLIPANWLPDWIEDSGSPTEGLLYYWLADSLCKFDIQQFLGLLSANTTGELNLPVMTLLIRVIDRVLSIVVGGNALLPSASEGTSNRNPLTGAATSCTTLEETLGNGQNFATLLQMLLYYLNMYIEPIGKTVFPLLASKAVKSATFKQNSSDAGTVNYLGGHQITLEELQGYYDAYQADANAVPYSGSVEYSSSAKAENLATAMGLKVDDVQTVTVNGAQKFRVNIPESFANLANANAAAEAVEAYTGETCYTATKRAGGRLTYTVMQKLNYLTATATQTENHTYDPNTGLANDTWYTYTDFHRANLITNAAGNVRAGAYGAVEYGPGFRANFTEDYASDKAYYYVRFDDAMKDAKDEIDDFNSYAHSTLPDAYGAWIMYFINLQLNSLKIYDKDGDGVINVRYDTNPGVPSNPYPFTKASGYSTVVSYAPTEYYYYNTVAQTEVVKEALAYANELDEDGNYAHNVTLTNAEAESVVRLALGNMNFDITKDENDNYYTGTYQWAGLLADATSMNKVQQLCNNLGFTFKPDTAEPENTTIERPAFKHIQTSVNGSTSFGNFYTYTTTKVTEDGKEITINNGYETTTAISLSPIQDYDINAKDDVGKLKNNIQKAYTDFAKSCMDHNEALNDHYDNISWRAEVAESQINIHPSLNTLKFVLELTKGSYYPAGQNNGRNKIYNLQTGDLFPAYSKSTFEAFQKAYEFADQLKTYIENGGENATQSLVTTAYQAVLATWKKLEEYGGAADWSALMNYIEQAQEILAGPLGVDGNNIVKDSENGYTQDTLNNLIAALADAQALYNNNKTTYDTDHQEEVDEQAIDLYSVINALRFPEGVLPDLKIFNTYVGNVELASYKVEGDSRQLGVIFGLQEGVGLTQSVADESIYVSGYQLNGNDKKAGIDASSYGNGTGAAYRVYNTITGEVVKYYAVVVGDLNGDARIDGVDKTILDLYDSQNLKSTLPTYLQAAADVDHNGDINLNDIQKIKAHYTYQNQQGISGAVNGTIEQTAELSIIPAE